MQGLICGRENEETYLLGVALSAFGLATRTCEHIQQVYETWSEHPADFLVIAEQGNPEDILLEIQSLRSLVIAPSILICDPINEETQVRYYRSGIDLIVMRPYSLRMLPYIIQPLLRRNNSIPMGGLPDLVQPAIHLDTHRRSVIFNEGAPVHLTQLEFRLLYTLMVRRGETIPFEEIVSLVWGYHGEDNRELVRGLVQRLRAKIEKNPQYPRFILTEAGTGYQFNPHLEAELPG